MCCDQVRPKMVATLFDRVASDIRNLSLEEKCDLVHLTTSLKDETATKNGVKSVDYMTSIDVILATIEPYIKSQLPHLTFN